MVFSSLTFLCIFLPVTILLYYLLPQKIKNYILLIASIFFYAWGEPIYVLLMIFLIILNYFLGLQIEKQKKAKKLILVLAIICNLAFLIYFKYFGFFISCINSMLKLNIEIGYISLPIGISFFTFQILSYLIDLYRGKYKAQNNIINLALYVSFFPQLIAGPIVKYKDIERQLSNRNSTFEKFSLGIRRFIYGLGKKVLIANVLASFVDTVYSLESGNISCISAWVASILYTFQIYYDFSGYSDMAIGLGKMFGFDIMENFDYPYMSKSITEFWRRWHISLSTWFKEYVYIPLGGNRKGVYRTLFNLFVVFILTGIWHGAGTNFILWGLYNGVFIVCERILFQKHKIKNNVIGVIYTFIVVNTGWVLFRAPRLLVAVDIYKTMFSFNNSAAGMLLFFENFNTKILFVAVVAFFGSGIIKYINDKFHVLDKFKNTNFEMFYLFVILFLCITSLASNSYNPFIYFRF